MKTPESEGNNESLEVAIEQATIADLEAIQSLNQELCRKENIDFDPTINPDYAFSESGAQYFRSRLESVDGLSLLAKENGEAVGYLVGGIVAPEDYRTITSVAELENMYVKDAMRAKGVGAQLVEKFEAWCKEKGVNVIRVVASAENNDAIRFYKARGAKAVSLTLEKNLEVR